MPKHRRPVCRRTDCTLTRRKLRRLQRQLQELAADLRSVRRNLGSARANVPPDLPGFFPVN